MTLYFNGEEPPKPLKEYHFHKSIIPQSRPEGLKYLRTSYAKGKTTYHGVISDSYIKCSKCNSHKVVRSGGALRTLKLLPTGTRHNLLRLFIPRVVCKKY